MGTQQPLESEGPDKKPESLIIQRKLAIGSVDDPLEYEADTMADKVMRMPETNFIQRKCSHCEEEEKMQRKPLASFIQRKGSSGGFITNDNISNQVHALKSNGSNLDKSTMSFMESRFGADFGGVKIHTGRESIQMNRELGAQAFTFGSDIYFNEGKYQPHSAEGKRLLAHELTHTIQQQKGEIIQRVPAPAPLPATVPVPAPGDFRINEINTSTQSRIFFGRGVSTFDPIADSKITFIKKIAKPPSVSLVGYRSADESASMASKRAKAVKTALTATPDQVAVSSAVGKPGAMSDQSDFSFARSVEVLVGATPASSLNCKLRAGGVLVNPPKQDCAIMDPATNANFNTAQPIAKDAVERASKAVKPANPTFNARLIDKFFGNHTAGTLSTLDTNFTNLLAHVISLPGITKCGGQCDIGGCDSGEVIAYNEGVDAASTMTLCVPEFSSINSNDRIRNLIHESAHGTTPLGGPVAPAEGTSDLAYRYERIIFNLAATDRLRNSDSYALFALYVLEEQKTSTAWAVPAGITGPAHDTITGFSATDESKMEKAIASLEKRLSWATDYIGQLYGQVVDIRAGKYTWAASWAESLMKEAALKFPLTKPPAKPTKKDQIRIAGILDRYSRMQTAVKRKDLTITHMPVGIVNWPVSFTSSAGNTLEVGPDYFTASPDDRVALLLENLAKATLDVEPAYIPAYVSLAKWIHDQNP